jgi:hypothetical protein
MKGFGVHTSMWTMAWDEAGARRAIAAANAWDDVAFIEIALLDPDASMPRWAGSCWRDQTSVRSARSACRRMPGPLRRLIARSPS